MEAPTAGTPALSTAPTGMTAAAPVADGACATGASEEDLPVGDVASMVQTRADFVPFMKDDLPEIMKGPFGSAYEAPLCEFLAHKQRVLDAQQEESDATVHLVGRPLKASRLFIPTAATTAAATAVPSTGSRNFCHERTAYIYDKGFTNKTLFHKHLLQTFVPIKSQKRQMAFESPDAKISRDVAASRIVIEQLNMVHPPPPRSLASIIIHYHAGNETLRCFQLQEEHSLSRPVLARGPSGAVLDKPQNRD